MKINRIRVITDHGMKLGGDCIPSVYLYTLNLHSVVFIIRLLIIIIIHCVGQNNCKRVIFRYR